jgi:hypothetical protein
VTWQPALKRGITAFSMSMWRDVVCGSTHFLSHLAEYKKYLRFTDETSH